MGSLRMNMIVRLITMMEAWWIERVSLTKQHDEEREEYKLLEGGD